jgi:hypothetical protein
MHALIGRAVVLDGQRKYKSPSGGLGGHKGHGGENGSQIEISRILLYIPPALTSLLVGMADFVTQNKGLHGLGVRSVI